MARPGFQTPSSYRLKKLRLMVADPVKPVRRERPVVGVMRSP